MDRTTCSVQGVWFREMEPDIWLSAERVLGLTGHIVESSKMELKYGED